VDLNLYAKNYQIKLTERSFWGLFYKEPIAKGYAKFTHHSDAAAIPLDSQQCDGLGRYQSLPFKLGHIPEGTYASYIYTGPYSLSEQSHAWLYGYWLPANGLRACTGPIIEEYLNDPRKVGPLQLRTRILVKVELI